MKNRSLFHLSIVLLLVALQACTQAPQATEVESISTVEAPRVEASTATATQEEPTPTEEPAPPTSTQEPTPIPPTETPQATSTPMDLGPTQTALAPILADLQLYGVDPNQGQLGWIQPTLTVEIDQHNGLKFEEQFPEVVAKDFILSSDITWDTEYGGSGCGFAIRSNGDQQAPSEYLVIASRQAGGYVYFAVMAEGQLIVGKEFYVKGLDPDFDAKNGATNRLTVISRGTNFTVYLNNTKLGEASPNDSLPPPQLPIKPTKPTTQSEMPFYQAEMATYSKIVNKLKEEYNKRIELWTSVNKDFESGSTALGVVTESGRAQCQFKNSWLWLIGAPGE